MRDKKFECDNPFKPWNSFMHKNDPQSHLE